MHCVDPLITRSYNYNTTYGASGRIRTCVHFVRSEGHRSSLARTLKPGQGRRISTFDAASQARSVGRLHHTLKVVGELRIELRPRASKARMQRITLFPDGGCPRYRTGLSGFSDQRFHLISLAAACFCLFCFLPHASEKRASAACNAGGPCGNRTHLTILLAKQATTPGSPTARTYSSSFPACFSASLRLRLCPKYFSS